MHPFLKKIPFKNGISFSHQLFSNTCFSVLTDYQYIFRSVLHHRRCEGVRGSSESSLDTYDKGLQLRIISISITTVNSSSQVSLAPLIVFFRHLLTDFTSLSNTPPHQSSFSRLNVHLICSLVKCCFTPGSLKILVISRAAGLNVFAIVGHHYLRSSSSRCKSSKTSQECISRQVWYKIQMDGSSNATRVNADPYLLLRTVKALDIE